MTKPEDDEPCAQNRRLMADREADRYERHIRNDHARLAHGERP